MLRKRTRSVHKDQPQMGLLRVPDSRSESYYRSETHKTSSLFSIPRLFVGFTPKVLSDCDSAKSPTSPLDFKLLPTVGGGNTPYSSPRSPHRKSWDRSRLGLSIVDSLDDDLIKTSGKVPRPSESRNILFGPGVRSKTSNTNSHTYSSVEAAKSLPRNFAIVPRNIHTKSPLHKGSSDVLFEIGVAIDDPEPPFGRVRSCSLDSCRSYSSLPSNIGQKCKPSTGTSRLSNLTTAHLSPPLIIGGSPNTNGSSSAISTLSASELELSEDYTCVISHGPNPKKTHIYGDCVLECHLDDLTNLGNKVSKEAGLPSWDDKHRINPASFPSDHFLSFCHYCNKDLEEGKDIYIYRGEKAFCSLDCRSQEIMIDEEFEEENTINDDHGDIGEVLEKTMNKSFEDFLKVEEEGSELSESSILYAP